MFKIKSEELNLDGEFETAFAVFGKGDESQCIFGGSFDDADAGAAISELCDLLGVEMPR